MDPIHYRCCCGKAQCDDVYQDIMEKASDPHVWKDAPFRLSLDVQKSSSKTWLLLLGVCHHITPAKVVLENGIKTFVMHRHHFPLPLLRRRDTYGCQQFATLMTKDVAQGIAQLDA